MFFEAAAFASWMGFVMGYDDPDGNHNWTRKKKEKKLENSQTRSGSADKLQSRWSQPAIKPRPPKHKRNLTWVCGNFTIAYYLTIS